MVRHFCAFIVKHMSNILQSYQLYACLVSLFMHVWFGRISRAVSNFRILKTAKIVSQRLHSIIKSLAIWSCISLFDVVKYTFFIDNYNFSSIAEFLTHPS